MNPNGDEAKRNHRVAQDQLHGLAAAFADAQGPLYQPGQARCRWPTAHRYEIDHQE